MSETAPEAASDSGQKPTSRRWLRVTGASLALLTWYLLSELFLGVVPYITRWETMALSCILGAAFGNGRGRRLLWGFAVFGAALFIFIAFSPAMAVLVPRLARYDPPERAPAVLILAGGVDRRGVMDAHSRTRLDRGLELLGKGYAPRLVLTEAGGRASSWVPTIKRRMETYGLEYPIDSVGPIINTYQESQLVIKLMRERGWDRIILVTHPWHMRRAAALFEKAGLRVICIPCEELEFDPLGPKLGAARVRAFRVWAHEAGALLEYRMKGWID